MKLNCDTIIINGELLDYSHTPNEIRIYGGGEVKPEDMERVLHGMQTAHPELAIWALPIRSLVREWQLHRLLYKLGIMRRYLHDTILAR